MSIYVDTEGKSSLGIGICARCKMTFPIVDLMDDPNSPGLKVCVEDRDVFDPWRLPPPPPDAITLRFVRPDEPIEVPE